VRAFDLPVCDFSPLEGLAGVELLGGDIGDLDRVRSAVVGVDVVVHLAALLPPVSERDREATMAVNVGGTENVVKALEQENRDAHLIFSSSVSVYGDTTGEQPPIRVSHTRRPSDWYAESKIEAERIVLGGSLPYTILRISGISVPAFLEPPAVWPFVEDQRIEFVCRTDVVKALSACVHTLEAVGKVFNIAGGPTWQMLGRAYVEQFGEVMGLPFDEARYSSQPGYFDWYDTDESQAVLQYQQTTIARFLELLEQAIGEALGGVS